jgi:hypothetical protein
MRRLEDGDITAAWEDIVARLTDLGEPPSAAATPRQLANSVDTALMPLAIVYGRSIYGPADSIEQQHVDTATQSLDQTRTGLINSHSVGQRIMAAYRPATVIPQGLKRTARRTRTAGNGSNQNGS